MKKSVEADAITKMEEWWESERWRGTTRPYTAEDVCRLRGSISFDHGLASYTANKFLHLMNTTPYVSALGAMTGNQAVQIVQAGLKAIYLSGWQVAADNNLAAQTYPDLSLYPANSVPELVRRINQALQRADQIQHMDGEGEVDWYAPIIADAEAGFGGALNAFELMKGMIEAGAAAVHYEDQLGSEKKCGHLGGKVLVPTQQFVRTLVSARLAADVMGVPTVLIARTDAEGAKLLSNDVDSRDQEFMTGERTPEGFHRVEQGVEHAIMRGRAYAPYADILWCETSTPNLDEAKRFATGIHDMYPGKWLAYNCSPSFNWDKNLSSGEIQSFQEKLAEMGYKFQFITLAGFHTLNHSMFELASMFAREGVPAYVRLQRREFEAERKGYRAVKHQSFVGTGYFDEVSRIISGGESSTTAMNGSTELAQFEKKETEPQPAVEEASLVGSASPANNQKNAKMKEWV